MPEALGLTPGQLRCKRAFDVLLAAFAFVVSAPVCAVAVVAATLDTRQWGIFAQTRIGRDGVPFRVFKIRTMRTLPAHTTTVTTVADPRITTLGGVLRRFKLDELPQLVNVLRGEMSFVGPRPDVAGFADTLTGPDRCILSVPPGITGPASLAFRHEEQLLATAEDPERYNREVIWPEKVRLNREYVQSWSLRRDLRCIIDTALSVAPRGVDV
jgi:lipopolysaccharide/colanic/teichoic acid biosynthesis glycosyltransferase